MDSRDSFEKWAKNEGLQICKGQPWEYLNGFTSRAAQGWNARQPEIDALKSENRGMADLYQKKVDGCAEMEVRMHRQIETLKAENERLKAEVEQLHNKLVDAILTRQARDAELLKLKEAK